MTLLRSCRAVIRYQTEATHLSNWGRTTPQQEPHVCMPVTQPVTKREWAEKRGLKKCKETTCGGVRAQLWALEEGRVPNTGERVALCFKWHKAEADNAILGFHMSTSLCHPLGGVTLQGMTS